MEYRDIRISEITTDLTVEVYDKERIAKIAKFMKCEELDAPEWMDVVLLDCGRYSLKCGEIAYEAAVKAGLKTAKVAVLSEEQNQIIEIKEIDIDLIINNDYEPISWSETWTQAVDGTSKLFTELGGNLEPLILCDFGNEISVASGEEIYYAAIMAGTIDVNCSVVSNSEDVDAAFINSIFC